MTSDAEFFSMEIAGMKVNLLFVFMTMGISAGSFIIYLKMTAGPSTEGRCPIDHKNRIEMAEMGKKQKKEWFMKFNRTINSTILSN